MTPDRKALNQAFWELGLRFQWDENTWALLAGMRDLRSQLAYYLGRYHPHLLSAYDVDSLGSMIEHRLQCPGSSTAMEATCSF